ncbi:MAG: hypothetical protein HOE90_10435 [Bacteriovoracaceae bacterium]|jgi:hypothetical protein|nr:hypothetical protein [Bacteriovoracaceae bacterium]
MRPSFLFFTIILSTFITSAALADSLENWLEKFHQNPSEMMNLVPAKFGDKRIDIFEQTILDPYWSEKKDSFRNKLIQDQLGHKGPITGNDLVENLLEDGQFISSVFEMESLGLKSAEVETPPWSDDYWPIYKGMLGNRYFDFNFRFLPNWKESYDYITANTFDKVYQTKDAADIDTLSPSEKYDLLLGVSPHLTTPMWALGKNYFEKFKKVERWMGLCHGWAPAAFMVERPRNKVEVMSFDGETKISFYPSDIKALITLLWANVRTPVNFVGGRCDVKNVERDDVGRIKENDCFDTNPGTWHQAVVNLIGKDKRSFVIDATFDYEVWNQPVVSYNYRYFNPQTLAPVDEIQDGLVKKDDFLIDKFKSYRSPDMKQIIGVAMEVKYLVENPPSHRLTDSPENDLHQSVTYVYDLELDENGKIVGGEWYQNAHPDFLWVPLKSAKPLSSGDYLLLGDPLWDGKLPLKAKWTEQARKAAYYSQPLAKIIESLNELSQKSL